MAREVEERREMPEAFARRVEPGWEDRRAKRKVWRPDQDEEVERGEEDDGEEGREGCEGVGRQRIASPILTMTSV